MWLWRIIGFLFLSVGAVGLILPVLPTTIFWIVAALAFAKSDPAWRDWIYARPVVGERVQAYIERGELNRASKLTALSGMTMASGLCAFLLWGRPWLLGLALALIATGAAYVMTRREG